MLRTTKCIARLVFLDLNLKMKLVIMVNLTHACAGDTKQNDYKNEFCPKCAKCGEHVLKRCGRVLCMSSAIIPGGGADGSTANVTQALLNRTDLSSTVNVSNVASARKNFRVCSGILRYAGL